MNTFKTVEISGNTDLRVTRVLLGPDSIVGRFWGALDGVTAADLDRRLETLLAPMPKHILLDLGGVNYLSSMGLSVLLKTAIRAKASGSLCQFYDPQLSVRRVLEISKWDHLILSPESIASDSPFFGYVYDEEPVRTARRAKGAPSNPPRLYPD